LSTSNTNKKLTWDSSLLELSPQKKPSQSLVKIFEAGIKTIYDLLWVFPLRIQKTPSTRPFSTMYLDELFQGEGEVINISLMPAFGKRGKGKIQLFNATVVLKDLHSEKMINLKWFNTYPSFKNQIEKEETLTFLGEVKEYKGVLQIINPKLNPEKLNDNGVLIEYPTLNSVSGINLKKIFKRIPDYLWDTPLHIIPREFEDHLKLPPLNICIKTLHGIDLDFSKEKFETAKERLIYQEFLNDQLKVIARKESYKKINSDVINIDTKELVRLKKLFPYELTVDQNQVLKEINNDFSSGHPMMRIVQGDVGCGKTTVALIAALQIINENKQVALMCPTEALATQHLATFKEILKESIKIELLLGSTSTSAKKHINQRLKDGDIDLIIGTHSLFQDSVEFKSLNLAIIDEQHKFGVEQRQKLVNKGHAAHTLIMSATPIPRTLQLAQYGDLDISTIKSTPPGRKGTQTRIVKSDTYAKYLSFIKTRVSIGEQVFICVPAIEESEAIIIKNVNKVQETYKKLFPELRIGVLHGQLNSVEKSTILNTFTRGEIDILISTSVIEVGINVLNATVMAIYDPQRFGLSSIHQLRGRVGRGSKPGFCFLITDENTQKDALTRLKIIEKNTDGFIIAEADLKNRGEGDLFGVNQSGNIKTRKVASIFQHFDIYQSVMDDLNQLLKLKPELITPLIDQLLDKTNISLTI